MQKYELPARGYQAIKIVHATGRLIGPRWCVAGDIIRVGPKHRNIMPVETTLDVWHAEQLILSGAAVPYAPRAGDVVIEDLAPSGKCPQPQIEAATLTPQRQGAAQAVAPRQRSGAI